MSKSTKELRAAILRQIKHRQAANVSELAKSIRLKNPKFRSVPDFDFRANVLSLAALGQLGTRPKLHVAKNKPLSGH